MSDNIIISRIEKMIYIIRDQKVMLDSDLAELYGVKTKVLNQAVKRNIERFPPHFAFECNYNELQNLRSQIVTSSSASSWNHKKSYLPMLFTENGIAMLSSVLKSSTAVQVNISIMRKFTKMRSLLAMEGTLEDRLNKLEVGTNKLFKIVFERMEILEEGSPPVKTNRKKIGLKI